MWFRNSGGLVGATPVPEASPSPQPPRMSKPGAFIAEQRYAEQDGTQSIQYASNGENYYESMNGTNEIGPPASDNHHHHLMDFRVGTGNWTEENAASLFFDPSLNTADLYQDFDWLFENISTDFNPNGDLPAVASPETSISASNISPPSLPPNTPHAPSYHSAQPSSAPWVAVQGRLLEALGTLPPEIFMSSFFYPSNLSYFYDLYFENYHPHFPIIHKPTFHPTKASPLLMAAILTLGSTLSSDIAHFETATRIHDTLRYIIFNVRPYSWVCRDCADH